jgi:hypothetical protein
MSTFSAAPIHNKSLLALKLRTSGAIPLLPHTPSRPAHGQHYPYYAVTNLTDDSYVTWQTNTVKDTKDLSIMHPLSACRRASVCKLLVA